jgi:putative ABC transport system permease protein
MRIAVRELRRQPGRFAVAGATLTLLVVLLLFLGGLLDGLFLGSTGAIRAQDADVIVFSSDARQSFLRSRIGASLRQQIDALPEVERTGGLGFSLLAAAVPGEDDLADVAVAGYDRPTGALPDPPPPGSAFADRRLAADGVEVGDVVLVGEAQTPVEVIGWVDDTNYLLQGGLWVEPGTWRAVQNAARPDAVVADGEFQALAVDAAAGVDAEALTSAIDSATQGATESLSQEAAVRALPGISEQETTFTGIIWATLLVAGLVVALFFALITIERLDVYSLLKAIGGSSGALAAGVVIQAVVVSVVSFAAGALVTAGLAQFVPPEVPVQFERSRALFVLVAVVGTAVVGSAVSLRRIVRVDPAANIGAGV